MCESHISFVNWHVTTWNVWSHNCNSCAYSKVFVHTTKPFVFHALLSQTCIWKKIVQIPKHSPFIYICKFYKLSNILDDCKNSNIVRFMNSYDNINFQLVMPLVLYNTWVSKVWRLFLLILGTVWRYDCEHFLHIMYICSLTLSVPAYYVWDSPRVPGWFLIKQYIL